MENEKQNKRNKIVRKMLRNRVVGAHNKTVDTIVGWSFASHDEGKGREILEEMVTNPEAPVEAYGGQRGAVRLTSVEAAVNYLKSNGGDVPFGFE